MQVVDNHCATLILAAYLLHGAVGILVEYAAVKQAQENEESATTPRRAEWDRLDRRWKRSRLPVWLGLIVAGWFLCQ